MGVKMGWIQIKMGHPLTRNGAALAPFRANGAHPSYFDILAHVHSSALALGGSCAHAQLLGIVAPMVARRSENGTSGAGEGDRWRW